jgi:predicted glycosyltransferase
LAAHPRMTPSILFHVQHLLGIGHTRRGALLAQAMERHGLAVTALSGGEPVPAVWGGAEIIQLPWARAVDASFRNLVDEHGQPLDAAFHERRRCLVLEAFGKVRPAVLLLESFPFGRRAFRPELTALIAAAHAAVPRVPVLTSLRDIVVARPAAQWAMNVAMMVRRDIDAVLVHGDPGLVPLEASFAATPQIADRLHYTGYVAPPLLSRVEHHASGEVLVSVGGGAVGGALLRAALAARPHTSLADRPWRLIAGPNLPDATYRALAQNLPAGVVLERFRSDFPELLRRCHLSLSQAGYNTVLDLLQAAPRAVVVPFGGDGENEQALRARLLSERGVLHVLPEASLADPNLLAAALDRAAAAQPPRVPPMALDGAERSAALVAEFARPFASR